LGAEVIKIEEPKRGDDTRSWGPPFLDPDTQAPLSAYYLACNRNKRSVTVDIAHPKGAALIRQLAKTCDVVLENFKVGGLARYGLDYASLRAVNPALVYCSITGFGQDGPYAARGGYDFLIQGMGGLMSVTGPAGSGEDTHPTKVGVPVTDLFTGLYAVISIQAALRHRDQTGEGQHIDCALLDTQVAILANQGMNWLVGGRVPAPMGNDHPTVVPYRTFAVADGHVIVAVGNDGQFHALCQLLDRPQIAADPRYASNALRVEHRHALEHALTEALRPWSSADLITAMAAAGVPGGPINRINQVFEDPQVIARQMVDNIETDSGTAIPQIRYPARLSSTPATLRRPPPRLGQDTVEVLTQALGLDHKTLTALQAQGIIGS
jgi:crotonobetainyl-CoA:carnitine CoA-transferase CaiB-like acyl-CoA transferase